MNEQHGLRACARTSNMNVETFDDVHEGPLFRMAVVPLATWERNLLAVVEKTKGAEPSVTEPLPQSV